MLRSELSGTSARSSRCFTCASHCSFLIRSTLGVHGDPVLQNAALARSGAIVPSPCQRDACGGSSCLSTSV